MQPTTRDEAHAAPPIPEAAPPTEAPPSSAIAPGEPAEPIDSDGTTESDADVADSKRPTRKYEAVLGGEATD